MKNHILIICFLFFGINISVAQNLDWAKSINSGGIFNSFGNLVSSAVDDSGNEYLTGFFRDTTDFDPGSGVFNLTSNGLGDIYILKLDANGNFLWVKAMGSNELDAGESITLDSNGNIYTTGSFTGTVDFDPSAATFELTAPGSERDIFIQKLDSDGNFIWAKRMGSSEREIAYSITTDLADNVYTTGSFFGTVDFDPNVGSTELTSNGSADIFIQKLDTNGNFIWAKSMGSTAFVDYGVDIKTDQNGNVYSTGNFADTVDFDPNAGIANLTSNGSDDIYIQKLDTNGIFIWAKSYGGSTGDYIGALEVYLDNIYSIGSFPGTIDFDPNNGITNLTSAGSNDIFIQKLNANGDFIWARRIGGSEFDEGLDIAADSSGDLYCAGAFPTTVDFDPNSGVFNMTPEADYNGFILKLDANTNFIYALAIGGTAYNAIKNLNISTIGEVYSSGAFANTGDFDPGSGVTNLTAIDPGGDLFIQKFSSTLSAEEYLNQLQTKVFPNPTSGSFTINLGKSYSEINTTITNMLGQVIASEKFENTNNLQLEIEKATGIYIVNVSTSEGLSETIKIIKN
ncbi:SBBP repeat-containing protein [Ulvibacter antarcticus]|uniref:Putative secreted protein (Por secretion system target) n=1 Tax=Ulvibacter antarcticus TaxID=442714 RepID=A0A3L9Z1M9_9FLAO|nr:SBBP repeat-containing protein [Ulvibacter antarcticus]RMA66434.1 putative secreted protein (Por secretion system target) [Ulvibacter antarcticus]